MAAGWHQRCGGGPVNRLGSPLSSTSSLIRFSVSVVDDHCTAFPIIVIFAGRSDDPTHLSVLLHQVETTTTIAMLPKQPLPHACPLAIGNFLTIKYRAQGDCHTNTSTHLRHRVVSHGIIARKEKKVLFRYAHTLYIYERQRICD